MAANIPFMFTSGYGASAALPEAYADVTMIPKPLPRNALEALAEIAGLKTGHED